ncbi:MAG: hypothetical protein AAB225_13375 [Acidobacteriota bacterium]
MSDTLDPQARQPRKEQRPRRRPDPAALARLLDDWMQGDEAEQRETFEFLRQSLDEDRPAGYKLFS